MDPHEGGGDYNDVLRTTVMSGVIEGGASYLALPHAASLSGLTGYNNREGAFWVTQPLTLEG